MKINEIIMKDIQFHEKKNGVNFQIVILKLNRMHKIKHSSD